MIETSQLNLSRPIPEDYQLLCELWRNKRVRQFLGGTVVDEEINERLISIQKHWDQYNFGLFTVRDKNSEKVTGICGLYYSENDFELSYMFFPEHWGKGIAAEATLACVYYGFEILKLEEILAITQEANQNSWKLLEKLGMYHTNTISKFNSIQRVYKLTKQGFLLKPDN